MSNQAPHNTSSRPAGAILGDQITVLEAVHRLAKDRADAYKHLMRACGEVGRQLSDLNQQRSVILRAVRKTARALTLFARPILARAPFNRVPGLEALYALDATDSEADIANDLADLLKRIEKVAREAIEDEAAARRALETARKQAHQPADDQAPSA